MGYLSSCFRKSVSLQVVNVPPCLQSAFHVCLQKGSCSLAALYETTCLTLPWFCVLMGVSCGWAVLCISLQFYFCSPCSQTTCSAVVSKIILCGHFSSVANNGVPRRSLAVSTGSWILFMCLMEKYSLRPQAGLELAFITFAVLFSCSSNTKEWICKLVVFLCC